MKNVVTKAVKGNVKKQKKANSLSLQLRTNANNNWKKETFSLSALVRYAQGTGKEDVNAIIDFYNEKYGSKVNIGNINTKNIVAHASEKELQFKDGRKKDKFSFWLVVLTIGRLAKATK